MLLFFLSVGLRGACLFDLLYVFLLIIAYPWFFVVYRSGDGGETIKDHALVHHLLEMLQGLRKKLRGGFCPMGAI